MPKTYVVGGNQGVGVGGMKIDSIPNPLACGGNALSLAVDPSTAVHVPKAGLHEPVDFANKRAIYTTGLSHCLAVCIAYNKVGNQFQDGYLAHISSPQAGVLKTAMDAVPNPAVTPMWVVVSVGAGEWPDKIAKRLQNDFKFPPNNIWIYIRQDSNSFGLDRDGNFGEV